MNAYVLDGIKQLSYKNVKMPECPENWAIVEVKAAGICSSDIPRIFKKGTYHFPTIPGHEFSGIVKSANNSQENDWIGQHVGVFPLIPCFRCEQCMMKYYEMCANYDYIGSRRDGGFAEYVAVPIWNLIKLSDSISFEDAAMLEPLSVALHAIKRARIQRGDKIGIIGTGMIGFAAAQWAMKYGASSVTIIGRSNTKKDIATKIGVEFQVIGEISSDFNVLVEAVGSNDSIDASINALKPFGRLVLMGNPEGDILFKQNTYWRILRKQLSITGTWNSSYDNDGNDIKSDWNEARTALEKHQIATGQLISHIFKQNDLPEALNIMSQHREPYCKIMTTWNR